MQRSPDERVYHPHTFVVPENLDDCEIRLVQLQGELDSINLQVEYGKVDDDSRFRARKRAVFVASEIRWLKMWKRRFIRSDLEIGRLPVASLLCLLTGIVARFESELSPEAWLAYQASVEFLKSRQNKGVDDDK